MVRAEGLPVIGFFFRNGTAVGSEPRPHLVGDAYIERALGIRDRLKAHELMVDMTLGLARSGNAVLLREVRRSPFVKYELWFMRPDTEEQDEARARGVRIDIVGASNEGNAHIDFTSGNGWKFFQHVDRTNVGALLEDAITRARPDIDYRGDDEGEILYRAEPFIVVSTRGRHNGS